MTRIYPFLMVLTALGGFGCGRSGETVSDSAKPAAEAVPGEPISLAVLSPDAPPLVMESFLPGLDRSAFESQLLTLTGFSAADLAVRMHCGTQSFVRVVDPIHHNWTERVSSTAIPFCVLDGGISPEIPVFRSLRGVFIGDHLGIVSFQYLLEDRPTLETALIRRLGDPDRRKLMDETHPTGKAESVLLWKTARTTWALSDAVDSTILELQNTDELLKLSGASADQRISLDRKGLRDADLEVDLSGILDIRPLPASTDADR